MKAVKIEGGGICGLALGNALARKGVPVSVLEKGRYPRHRVCGEFLAGLTSGTLQILNLEDLFADAPIAETVAWFRGGKAVAQYSLPGTISCLSRFAMDQELANRFREAGGILETGHRVDLREAPLEGTVRTLGKASGQSSRLGLKAHFRNLSLEADLEMHLGEQAYVGLSRVEDGWVNVSGLFERRRGLQAKKESWLDTYLRASGLNPLADRLAKAEMRPDSFCGVSGFAFALPGPGNEDQPVLSLGDHHAMIPPFTGNGMTMAFESAALALPFLLAYSQGKSTWPETVDKLTRARNRRFNGRLQRAIWLQSLLEKNLTQNLLCGAARAKLLPFQLLYRLLH